MDIKSNLPYPAGALSNFAPYYFVIDGVECFSMEGFLQSLKESDPEVQKEICKLIGKEAKNWNIAHTADWQKDQILWWQGKKIDRHSQTYQELIDKAYESLFQNEDFRKTLGAAGQEELTHSIGETDSHKTILTEEEFCSRLINLRNELNKSTIE